MEDHNVVGVVEVFGQGLDVLAAQSVGHEDGSPVSVRPVETILEEEHKSFCCSFTQRLWKDIISFTNCNSIVTAWRSLFGVRIGGLGHLVVPESSTGSNVIDFTDITAIICPLLRSNLTATTAVWLQTFHTSFSVEPFQYIKWKKENQ